MESPLASAKLRGLAALAVAAALGVGLPARRLAIEPPPSFGNFPEWADRVYAKLRESVRPGERIGVVLASGDPNLDGGLHYSAQYALVPALVEPIYLGDCLRPERGPRCRIDAVQRVAVVPRDASSLAGLEKRLGLVRGARFGPVVILEPPR